MERLRQFITASDLERIAASGTRELRLKPGESLTLAAEEVAAKLGLRVTGGEEGATGQVLAASGPSAAGTSGGSVEATSDPRWPTGSLADERVIDAWREEFPILSSVIHVGNCSQSPQSRWVRRGIDNYLANWLSIGMDWDYWMEEVAKAKAEFAKLIGASPDEIAVTSSVSEAISSVASALPVGARRKIVATEAEFPTIGHVLLANQKFGYKVEFVPVRGGRVDMPDYDKYIDSDTLLTCITHVYYQNGYKQDVGAITALAHSRGSLVFVDDYQCLGTCPIDVKALGVDFLTSGNLKYLLGLPGIAFLYCRRELIAGMKPAVTGWFGQENPFAFQVLFLDYARDGRRFDTGTPPVMNAFAARAGMQIINYVGLKAIGERIDMLSRVALDAAAKRGLTVASPQDVSQKGATTAIEVPGRDSHAAEAAMKQRGIIGSARGSVFRVAPHFFTRPDEIERVMDELASVFASR